MESYPTGIKSKISSPLTQTLQEGDHVAVRDLGWGIRQTKEQPIDRFDLDAANPACTVCEGSGLTGKSVRCHGKVRAAVVCRCVPEPEPKKGELVAYKTKKGAEKDAKSVQKSLIEGLGGDWEVATWEGEDEMWYFEVKLNNLSVNWDTGGNLFVDLDCSEEGFGFNPLEGVWFGKGPVEAVRQKLKMDQSRLDALQRVLHQSTPPRLQEQENQTRLFG